MSDAATQKAVADLKAEQATRRQFEERVSKVEQELKDATRKCESLEEENKAKVAELAKAYRRPKRRGPNPERLAWRSNKPDR